MVGYDRLVHMDRALGGTGRAAREMQQRHALRIGGRHDVLLRGMLHELGEGNGPRGWISDRTHEQDMVQMGQAVPVLLDLAPVQRLGGDKDPGIAQLQPLAHGLGAEGREEWAQHARAAQCAQDSHIQFRAAAEEREDPLLPTHAEGCECVGEAACEAAELAIGEVGDGVVGRDAAQGLPPAVTCRQVSVDGLVSDVEPISSGQPRQPGSSLVPGEVRAGALVVLEHEVGVRSGLFADDQVVHDRVLASPWNLQADTVTLCDGGKRGCAGFRRRPDGPRSALTVTRASQGGCVAGQ